MGAGRAEAVDLLHRAAQATEPVVGVLTDEPHAPGERIGTRARHVRGNQRVEDHALGLTQPRHHGDGQVGEQVAPVTDGDPPGHLAFEAVLGLAGHGNALLGVSSRNPEMRPATASARSTSLASAGSSGEATVRTTVISSRSTVICAGAVEVQASGRRPRNHEVTVDVDVVSVVMAMNLLDNYTITTLRCLRLQALTRDTTT